MRLATLALLAACAHRPAPPVHDIAHGLTLAGVALSVAAPYVDEPGACVALTVSGEVVSTAAGHLSSGGALLPEVVIDYSGCGYLPDPVAVPKAGDTLARALGPVRALLGTVTADQPCELRHGADAVVVRLGLAVQVVFDELATPDGVAVVPAVPVEVCP